MKQLLYQLAAGARRQQAKGNQEAAIALWTARKYIKGMSEIRELSR